jgi:tetratricopeptide (TPR) repeat protein
MVGESFMQAWKVGANQWNEWEPKGHAQIYPISSAWSRYEPVGFGGEAGDISFPAEAEISRGYLIEIERFINREIYSQTSVVQNQIQKRGKSARYLNRLGTIYARYGKTDEANEYFNDALKLEKYFPAMLNIGNLYFLENNLDEALRNYREAEQIKPDSPILQIQIARVYNELGMFEESEKSFTKVKVLNPALAERYAFLDVSSTGAARASSRDLSDLMFWLDEEK